MILFKAGICISFILLIQFCDAYVLLQVRKKDNNHSNIDALIHKVIPSDKIEKFAQEMARKQATQNDVIENIIGNGGKEEEISMSVDDKSNKSDPDLIKLIDAAKEYITKPGGAVMRSNNQGNNPKKIKFRTGESSVLYEVNSQSLIKGIEELLSSKIVRRYLDKLTRKAAVVYRSMKESKQK